MTEKTANKTDMSQEMADDQISVEQWLAIRKEAGLHIDPETAELDCIFAQILDPYGVLELPEECHQVGRVWFARSPGGDVWVCFYDLPAATVSALWKRIKSGADPRKDEGEVGELPL
jgi:hypothetical protein